MPKPSVPAIIQFGSTANPASEIGQFGSYASPVFSNTLSTLMSGTAWTRGWFGETVNTNRPFIQDFNAVDFVFGSYLFYLMTLGVPEYIAAMTYWTNSIIQVAGQFFISLVDNNTGNTPASSPTQWQSGIPGMEISGVIKAYAGTVAPSGYLLCNGQAVSRSTYAALFTICGTTYGIGDGSTTFNVPNLQKNIPVGYLSGDPNFGTVGAILGEETHTLTVSELAVHGHSVSDPGHLHQFIDAFGGSTSGGGDAGSFNRGNENTSSSVTGISVGNTGSGSPHNNIQPSQVVGSYIIKT